MARAKNKTRRRTIMRQDIRRPEDTGETFEDIEKRVGKLPRGEAIAAGTTGPAMNLARNSIHVAAGVFQWRSPKHNMLPSDDHIFQMAQALLQQRTPLSPITVFQVGKAFYVMDGHHRLAAYDTARWTKAILAQVYQGSLEAAWRSALARNVRDKLPMDKEDKRAAAWRIVKNDDPRDSISIIMTLTGVSKGTVDNMRSTWRTINDGKHGDAEELQALSWAKARRRAEGREDDAELEDWREVEANKLVNALHKAKLIGRLTKSPDITALALTKLGEGLPAALIAEWSADEERPFDPHEPAGEDEEAF
jgi:hypothetical protein